MGLSSEFRGIYMPKALAWDAVGRQPELFSSWDRALNWLGVELMAWVNPGGGGRGCGQGLVLPSSSLLLSAVGQPIILTMVKPI